MKQSTKAQHEIMGFVLIIILVSVIGVVFLGLSQKDKVEPTNSPLAENFLESFLHQTTNCSKYSSGVPYMSVQDLAKSCSKGGACSDALTSCEALNLTVLSTLERSFQAGADYPLKGYSFVIMDGEEVLIYENKGNETENSKGSEQNLANDLNFYLQLYY